MSRSDLHFKVFDKGAIIHLYFVNADGLWLVAEVADTWTGR